MVSVIGTPICMDLATEEIQDQDYARVCIQVHSSHDLPSILYVDVPDGENVVQEVIYEWRPNKCEKCECFGHKLTDCKKEEEVQQPIEGINSVTVGSIEDQGTLEQGEIEKPVQAIEICLNDQETSHVITIIKAKEIVECEGGKSKG